MTAARRLAAILAVDVVGYSRLMGEDEAGTTRVHREAARPITFNATDGFPPPLQTFSTACRKAFNSCGD